MEVDLLPRVLADVADPEVSRRPIEAVAPRVAQALGPHRRLPAGPGVEPDHLAEERSAALGVVVRVAGAAAVAEADPQPAVGAEDDVAAVVVGIGLGH